MFNRKNLIFMTMFLILASAMPIMAADSGSAQFVVTDDLFVAGTEIAKGKYNASWQSTDEDAQVTFTPVGKKDGITVAGKIEQSPKKYDFNRLAIGNDSAGRKAIKQIQLAGKNFRIVFN